MKQNIARALCGLALALLVGCATDPIGKSLMSTDVTVDGAMQGWATWVAMGKTTLTQEAQVKEVYVKYQASFDTALSLYKVYYQTKDKTILEKADAILQAASQEVLNLITKFKEVK